MNENIFLVEDEEDISELISFNLSKNGFIVSAFSHGRDFLRIMEKSKPDLVILDLMLPDIDGLEICRRLKREKMTENIPVIMVTAKTDIFDKVLGLELGADDYIAKPFEPRELVARVRAVLRRYGQDKGNNFEGNYLEYDKIRLYADNFRVEANGEKIDLTLKEFKLLEIFLLNIDIVLSRTTILDFVWGSDIFVNERTIDVHIRNLREKLGVYSSNIKNIRGIGYTFESNKRDK